MFDDHIKDYDEDRVEEGESNNDGNRDEDNIFEDDEE